MTNREALRMGRTPCELNRRTGELAMLGDEHHADARFTALEGVQYLRVCRSCRILWCPASAEVAQGVQYRPETEEAAEAA